MKFSVLCAGVSLAALTFAAGASAETIRIAEHRQARIDSLKKVAPAIEAKLGIKRHHRLFQQQVVAGLDDIERIAGMLDVRRRDIDGVHAAAHRFEHVFGIGELGGLGALGGFKHFGEALARGRHDIGGGDNFDIAHLRPAARVIRRLQPAPMTPNRKTMLVSSVCAKVYTFAAASANRNAPGFTGDPAGAAFFWRIALVKAVQTCTFALSRGNRALKNSLRGRIRHEICSAVPQA